MEAEDRVCADYVKGIPSKVILLKYDITPGLLYGHKAVGYTDSILRRHHILLTHQNQVPELENK
jgi:hypothetical protein